MSQEVRPASEETTAAPAVPIGDWSAKAGTYYRNTRYVLSLVMILYGFWNIHDGFFAWPKDNADYKKRAYIHPELDPNAKPHSDADITINQGLGIILPPAGIALLIWALRNSRGRIKLEGETLSVPGHPPVPLHFIESIDKQKWDRKGIALVTYRLDTGKSGVIKLDDFVYEREPIDGIVDRVEKALQAPKVRPSPPIAPPPQSAAAATTPPPPRRPAMPPPPPIRRPPPPPPARPRA